MPPAPHAIALFAKAALPGRVKTRLQPHISPEESAELHWAFLRDTWEKLHHAGEAALYLYCDLDWPPAAELARDGRFALQTGDDLGERMFRCFDDLARAGHDRLMIVGADSPTLPAEFLLQGIGHLAETSAVLGPTEDGGYYAVGCRRPLPNMFSQVAWSKPWTLAQTQASFRKAGLDTTLLPGWYDIDTVSDLRRLGSEQRLPHHTGKWFEKHPRWKSATAK